MRVRSLAAVADAASSHDFPPLPGVAAQVLDGDRSKSRRKQTLLNLLDALQELSGEDDLGAPLINDQPSFEGDRDVPTVDEHFQRIGAEAFNRFQRRILNLDREVNHPFANAARQLGSSVGILSSSFNLRERLAQVLYLFRENAAELFPRKVARQPREVLLHPNMRHWQKSKRYKAPPPVANPAVSENLDPEDFPYQLQMFARDVMTFLDCLNEFPEFTDEAVNTSILSLEGQFRYPAVERYLHDISTEMGDHLDSITSSLSVFIEIGVPTIRFAQQHASQNLLNLTTVATFFSAVTATTMQFSYDMTASPLSQTVNTFWFTSLVFSIGAAVNSLLGLTWKQAMYRSPGHRVPWWVLIWIKRSPLVFLVLSVACFSVGLVLFAYSSGQDIVTRTLTTVFSALSCFGLAAVSMWFVSEKWIFLRHRGQKWLGDVLSETKVQVYAVPGISWIIHEPRALMQTASSWIVRQCRIAGDNLSRVSARTLARISSMASSSEKLEENEHNSPTIPHGSPDLPSPVRARTSDLGPLLPIYERSPATATSMDGYDATTVLSDDSTTSAAEPVTAKSRFVNAVRSVMMLRSAAIPFGLSPHSLRRQRTDSSDAGRGGTSSVEPLGLLRSSRVAALVPKLRSLHTTQDLAAHQALVRHLQFSPNGKFLATWDRTSVIFRVGDPLVSHRILAQPQGFVGQVAW
ncbi:predicted protein [Sparassis crispa]|uniref:Transmembrane protein n=1 Tax=Sparassis crispa TaxID=139825 RepID=A0A401H2T6_9APHY|nr:predicted protein [Sparassis crispa]GBE88718.1 predicted protein [Sparassis crispa]